MPRPASTVGVSGRTSSGPRGARFALAALAPLATLLTLATLFRVPALLNAGAVNSDAAIVGLQGRHMMQGEWAFRLWGTNYQGSLDSLLIGLSISAVGMKPIAIILVPFLGLLAMVALAFDVLRRHLTPWAAAACVMPLVFAPMASNLPMVYVMRQTLATTLTLAVRLADGAATSRHRTLRLALSASLLPLAFYIDLFAVVVLPAAGLFWLTCATQAVERAQTLILRVFSRKNLAYAVGLGLVGLAAIIAFVPGQHLGHNLELLTTVCLPFALGTKVFIKGEALVATPWSAPWPVFLVQCVGATIFLLSVASSWTLLRDAKVPWDVRKLGLFGAITATCTVCAFLASTKPVDMWSSRYLAPIFWTSPFALAPLAHRLEARRFALLHGAYWVTALVGGWLSYGPFVSGPVPRIDPRATAADEQRVHKALVSAGIHEAEAQYWLAYRLSYLFQEEVVVVPLDREDDRYAPYRARVEAAPRYAQLFHPSEPRALPETYARKLREASIPYERREISGFTVFIVDR